LKGVLAADMIVEQSVVSAWLLENSVLEFFLLVGFMLVLIPTTCFLSCLSVPLLSFRILGFSVDSD